MSISTDAPTSYFGKPLGFVFVLQFFKVYICIRSTIFDSSALIQLN